MQELTASNVNKRSDLNKQVREKLLGKGRPFVTAKSNGTRLIAVGNTITASSSWAIPQDFLIDHLKMCFGYDWFVIERAKPECEKHTVIRWHDHLIAKFSNPNPDGSARQKIRMSNGAAAYLGLAYNLYLIRHNVVLEQALINRLKVHDQFQGAYYELIVVGALTRCGFEIKLEDESVRKTKHCELSAISKTTGNKYWVEAKMKAVEGLFGKTSADGSSDNNPTSKLNNHLSNALRKPALDGQRIVFIDVNAPAQLGEQEPHWTRGAVRKLDKRTNRTQAYVFVTNFPFHRDLDKSQSALNMVVYGLGIPNFGTSGDKTFTEKLISELEHPDAVMLMESFQGYPNIPDNFEGKLDSETENGVNKKRPVIGELFEFENGLIGTPETIYVNLELSCADASVRLENGNYTIIRIPMSKQEISDYRKVGTKSYFGEQANNFNVKVDTDFEFYKELYKFYKKYPRDQIENFILSHKGMPEALPRGYLSGISDSEFLFEACEIITWMAQIFAKECDTVLGELVSFHCVDLSAFPRSKS